MRYYILLVFLLSIFSVDCFAQMKNESTHPFPGISNWDQTIKKASKENKIIMVDLSTEWCIWCKSMEKNQFADAEVLTLMLAKFQTYILDAEKDSIGQLFKLKYGVASYPSFLFFTPQGQYIKTLAGTMPKKYWMEYLKDSIENIPRLRPGIPSGLKFEWPDFVKRELKANFKNSKPSDQELIHFFNSCNVRKFEDFNVCMFYPENIPDTLLAKMFDDREWLDNNYGDDMVFDLLSKSINWKAYKQIQDSNWNAANNYIKLYASNFPQLDWELFNLKLFYFKTRIEVDSMIQIGIQHPAFVSDYIASELISSICKYGTTSEQFRQAEIWNKAELNKSVVFKFAKYQAQICYKLSDLTEAKKWAKIALEMAKKEGIDVMNDDELIMILGSTKENIS